MALWLPFDETHGPVARNTAGGNNGVWRAGGGLALPGNGPWSAPGMVGRSLAFDGVDDQVSVPAYPEIDFGVTDFTVETWVRRDFAEADNRVILDKRVIVDGLQYGFSLYVAAGRVSLRFGDGSVPESYFDYRDISIVPADGSWHHIAVVVRRGSNGVGRFYFDGAARALFNVGAHPNPIRPPGGESVPLTVGASPAGDLMPWKGGVDEVAMYPRALSAAEINSHWKAGSYGFCKVIADLPAAVSFCSNQTAVAINASICNNTPESQTFIYWFEGLPANEAAGCNVPGPTGFSPASGMITVPPFSWSSVPVSIARSAAYQFNPTITCLPTRLGCYRMLLEPLGGGAQVTISANVSAVNCACPSAPRGPIVVPSLVTTNLGFSIINQFNTPRNVAYRFRALDGSHQPSQTISLDSKSPGVPFTGIASLQPSRGVKISVPAAFVSLDSASPSAVVLELDADNNGTFEPVSSVELLNTVPPTCQPVTQLNPVTEMVRQGDSAVFTVAGTPVVDPLTVLWRKDGRVIPGATGPTFSVAHTDPLSSGRYDAVLLDTCGGAVLSSAAWLAFDCAGLGNLHRAAGSAGLVFAPLGTTSYSGVGAGSEGMPRQLTVGGIGASGNDGLTVELGGAEAVSLSFLPLPENTLAGSQLRASAVGVVNGVANRSLGSLSVVKTVANGAAPYDVTVDFSAIGSPTHRVEIWSNHVQVAVFPAQTGLVARLPRWPSKLGKLGGTTECFAACLPTAGSIVVAGTSVIGDELRVLAEPLPGHVVGAKSSFTVTAARIPQLALVGETVDYRSALFLGRQHTATGPAPLSIVNLSSNGPVNRRSLVVVPGTTGTDGAMIDLGVAEAVDLQFAPISESAAFGPSVPALELRAVGTLNGVPGQPLGSLMVRRGSPGTAFPYDVTADFSSLSSPTKRVEVWNNSTLVATFVGVVNPAARVTRWPDRVGKLGGAVECYVLRLPETGPVNVAGGTLIGNEIRILAESAPGVQVDSKSAFSFRVTGVPALALLNEQVSHDQTVFFGLAESAVGNARLVVSGAGPEMPNGVPVTTPGPWPVTDSPVSHLTVANIGSSGLDGVTFALGEGQSINLVLAGDHGFTTTPAVGAQLTAAARGTLGGVPNQSLGWLRFENRGAPATTPIEVTADFSSIGSPTRRVEVWNQGSLVVSIPGQVGPVGRVAGWPKKLGKLGGEVECYVAGWAAPVSLVVSGVPVEGDEIRILAEPVAGAPVISSKSAFSLLAGGIPEIVIEEAIAAYHQITFRGHEYTGVQNGLVAIPQLETCQPDGQLEVVNLGASGRDGVSVNLGFAEACAFELAQLPALAPEGAAVTVSAVGQVDGHAGLPLGWLRVSRRSDGNPALPYLVDVDFGDLGSITHRIQIYSNHVLVAEFSGHQGEVARLGVWPRKFGKLGGSSECYVACLPLLSPISVDGGVMWGDEVRVLAEAAAEVGYKSSFSIQAGGIPSFMIVGHEITTVPVISISPAPGGVSLSWDGAGFQVEASPVVGADAVWATIPGTSPLFVPANLPHRFFRLVRP